MVTQETSVKSKGAANKKDKEDEKLVDLTEEDKKLKDELERLVQVLQESNATIYQSSLESMKTLIRTSTTSMTAVPKPLKFMMQHYGTMKQIHENICEGPAKKLCADIISVLAMCSGEPGDCTKYRLIGANESIDDWGHDYVRHLTMEIPKEWKNATDEEHKTKLLNMVKNIVKHNMLYNAEVEACDLLLEIEQLDLLSDFVEEVDHERVCLYLLRVARLTTDAYNSTIIQTAEDIYLKYNKWLEALRCALIVMELDRIIYIFLTCDDFLIQKQMALLLGRQQIFLDFNELFDRSIDEYQIEQLAHLNSNSKLYHYLQYLGHELKIMESKKPEDVYKAHLENTRPFGGSVSTDSSARMILADAFVNGFVNCGFSADNMMSDQNSVKHWLNRNYKTLSATASLGLIYLWNINRGLDACYVMNENNDDYVRAGTLLAIGIFFLGAQNESIQAQNFLMDGLSDDKSCIIIGSILGLGLAYANSKKNTVLKNEKGGIVYELKKFLDNEPSETPEVIGIAGLSLGFILVGTADANAANDMLQLLKNKSSELANPNMCFLALGIALLFLGTQKRSEACVESLRALPEPFGNMVATLTEVCAYTGTGNVLKIQRLLHICSEHYETEDSKKRNDKKGKDEKKDNKPDLSAEQAVAVLGIGLISMGEDIGSEMSLRTFDHLIRYGEPVVRRAVPLALALKSLSNPQPNILETLSKLSHDADAATAHNAIFALGLVGAGTSNGRLVAMLRQLASSHHRDPANLMLVRLSQGLIHLGKGTLTLNPYHSDRQLMRPAAIAGVLASCFCFLDASNSVLNNHQHYLLYSLVLAIQPRFLITLIEDENDADGLKEIKVPVRVGQTVDIVAQAGRPKTITGFQTHTMTPVVLAYGERAELATQEYIALTPHLEGLVILRKNATYDSGKINVSPVESK